MKTQMMQTENDSLRACFATLLDLPIAKVPDFHADDPSEQRLMDRAFEFLRPLGFYPLVLRVDAANQQGWFDFIRGNYVMTGVREHKGPTLVNAAEVVDGPDTVIHVKHSVVATGRAHVVHDPHPAKLGVKALVHLFLEGDKATQIDGFEVWLFVRLSR